MDGIKVSQLPEASNVGNNDLFMIVQSGTSKKVTASKISTEWGNITGDIQDQTDLNTALGNKQDTLVSGTNIKTINNTSILGSGDISVGGNEIYIGDEQDAPATTKLVIEEQQAEWDGLPISNTYNTTTNNTYSCNYINNAVKDVYSTTEQVIGTWIDNKPIYRKVITGTATSNQSAVISNISNLDEIISIKGSVVRNGLYNAIDIYWDNTFKGLVQIEISTGDIYLNLGTGVNNSPYIIIIEYTKSTD